MRLIQFLSLLSLLTCNKLIEEDNMLLNYENCDFIEENIHEIDLFEGFFTLKLDYAYVPDIDLRDSLMNDYHYIKFNNKNLNGTYVIKDANVRYKVNKIEPYDSISKKEYPFSYNLVNEKACVFLDLLKSQACDC
ncbi:MAG: hypothetical protein P8L24_01795 [Cytophagales bacterium]|nr:hypothetical protein [Cytophagales bacterium]